MDSVLFQFPDKPAAADFRGRGVWKNDLQLWISTNNPNAEPGPGVIKDMNSKPN
jgi:hypothetical protein